MCFAMTMKMNLCEVFVLCSGFISCTFALNRLRLFSRPDHEGVGIHEDSLKKCREKNESLVTLFDEADANFTLTFANRFRIGYKSVWLGLHSGRNTTWSDGLPFTFGNSSVNVTDKGQTCVAIDSNTWRSLNCSERKPFMCYKGNNYSLIENKKSWCQALQYCRKHFSDLVSISSKRKNYEVIEHGKNKSFWIGLLHDKWEWADKSCSSFREWGEDADGKSENCTAYHYNSDPLLYDHGCESTANYFCSKGTVRIKVIDKKLTWKQAFDYCRTHHKRLLWIEDGEDQEAVEQWLNTTGAVGQYWIGLKQSRLLGFWFWSSDRTVDASHSKWKNGIEPEMPLSNNCGVLDNLYKGGNWMWSDVNCLVQLPFICEEEIVFMNT